MRNKTIEDYVELIYTLQKGKHRVHTNDIAAAFDVNPASVTEIFQKLRDLELKEKHLYPALNKISQVYYQEDQRILEHENIKSFYATAKFEHNEREKMEFQDEQKRVEEFRNSKKLKEIEELYKEKAEVIKKKVKNLKKKESNI